VSDDDERRLLLMTVFAGRQEISDAKPLLLLRLGGDACDRIVSWRVVVVVWGVQGSFTMKKGGPKTHTPAASTEKQEDEELQ
jgi:hypothetical protein